MIDPITALAAVSSVVSMIKKASKTVDDVKSLAPLIGRYFHAKHEAEKSIAQAKKKGGSFLGQAIEIEMEIMKQVEFESNLNRMFFETGNMDVWLAAKRRAVLMEKESSVNDIKNREKIRIKRIQDSEDLEFTIVCILLAVLLGLVAWGGYQFIKYCAQGMCGY
jgi:hypothetical protein